MCIYRSSPFQLQVEIPFKEGIWFAVMLHYTIRLHYCNHINVISIQKYNIILFRKVIRLK